MFLSPRVIVLYFLAATLLNLVLRGDPLFVGQTVFTYSASAQGMVMHGGYFTLALLGFAWWRSPSHREFALRLFRCWVALAICCIFLAAFSSVKTALPYVAEWAGLRHFFADPFFAALDRAIHFGVDPWRLTHDLTAALNWDGFIDQATVVYGFYWAILAFYLPALMVLLGENDELPGRFRHYMILYFFAWIGLGNIGALLGLSAGPIYYDRIFDTALFTDLPASMVAQGAGESFFMRVQEGLWEAYLTDAQAIGSGISAFPSLHVAMITVAALYLTEKHVLLGLVGWALALAVLFISVWVGYHYAIDGYVSAAAVLALHWWMNRRARAG